MLTLISQPRLQCPNTKSRPIRWQIQTNSHIIDNGNRPNFSLIFEGSGAIDGEEVTLWGEVFTVDNSVPYTESTWSTVGTLQEVSENFANMIRCSYHFRDWSAYAVYFTSSMTWRVQGVYKDNTTLPNWSWDFSGLSIPTNFNDTNGHPVELKNLRVWYQLLEAGEPVGDARQAMVPFNENAPATSGIVTIDATQIIRSLLQTQRPDINLDTADPDDNFLRSFALRFAEVELGENCQEIGGKVYETLQVQVTNTVYQLRDLRDFRRHCADAKRPADFITNRPLSMSFCGNTYEWIHFYFAVNSYHIGPFRVIYNFYDSDDQLLNTYEDIQQNYLEEAVYMAGVGTANPAVANNMVAGTSYYTFQVWADALDPFNGRVLVELTKKATRHLIKCDCKVAEVYYLEDTGSWRTVTFEKVEQRIQENAGLNFETPLNYSDYGNGYLYAEGSRSSETVDADNTFTFLTERLTPLNREMYEELLRSPRHWIRTVNTQNQEALRPVVIERENTTTYQRGGVTRLRVTFRYNKSTLVH